MRGGIWSAVLTPIDSNGEPDAARAVAYYRDLLQSGCDGINVLGTTGEAMSLGTEQRLRFMEAIASSGLPLDRAIVGTGATSLDDAARLTSHAFAIGFAAVLVMPPFFFRDVTDEGIVAFFGALLARANAPPRGLLLYNFPRMSGIVFRPALVERLLREFPRMIAGIKDSSNDAVLQTDLLARHPDLAIFPGAERDLVQAKARGAAGCISGSVALWPAVAHDVWVTGDAARAQRLAALRAALDGIPFVPAVRYLTAAARGETAWERAIAPLVSLSAGQRSALDRAFEPFRAFISGERPS